MKQRKPNTASKARYAESMALVALHSDGDRYTTWTFCAFDAEQSLRRSESRHGPAVWAVIVDTRGFVQDSDWSRIAPGVSCVVDTLR